MNPQKEQQKICLRTVLIDKTIQLTKRYEESNDETTKKYLRLLLDLVTFEYHDKFAKVRCW